MAVMVRSGASQGVGTVAMFGSPWELGQRAKE